MFCANGCDQEEVNMAVCNGLSDLFDVQFVGALTPDLVERLIGDDSEFGLLTHFPYSLSGDDLYGEAVKMIGDMRLGKPDLPILVYTGAGCGFGKSVQDAMRKVIIGAGAIDVVFKYESGEDIKEIREKMSRLLSGL